MSTATAFPTATPVRGFPVEACAAAMSRLVAEWRAARLRRRNVLSLRALSARTLADIGISRAEIVSIVHGGMAGRRVSYADR